MVKKGCEISVIDWIGRVTVPETECLRRDDERGAVSIGARGIPDERVATRQTHESAHAIIAK